MSATRYKQSVYGGKHVRKKSRKPLPLPKKAQNQDRRKHGVNDEDYANLGPKHKLTYLRYPAGSGKRPPPKPKRLHVLEEEMGSPPPKNMPVAAPRSGPKRSPHPEVTSSPTLLDEWVDVGPPPTAHTHNSSPSPPLLPPKQFSRKVSQEPTAKRVTDKKRPPPKPPRPDGLSSLDKYGVTRSQDCLVGVNGFVMDVPVVPNDQFYECSLPTLPSMQTSKPPKQPLLPPSVKPRKPKPVMKKQESDSGLQRSPAPLQPPTTLLQRPAFPLSSSPTPQRSPALLTSSQRPSAPLLSSTTSQRPPAPLSSSPTPQRPPLPFSTNPPQRPPAPLSLSPNPQKPPAPLPSSPTPQRPPLPFSTTPPQRPLAPLLLSPNPQKPPAPLPSSPTPQRPPLPSSSSPTTQQRSPASLLSPNPPQQRPSNSTGAKAPLPKPRTRKTSRGDTIDSISSPTHEAPSGKSMESSNGPTQPKRPIARTRSGDRVAALATQVARGLEERERREEMVTSSPLRPAPRTRVADDKTVSLQVHPSSGLQKENLNKQVVKPPPVPRKRASKDALESSPGALKASKPSSTTTATATVPAHHQPSLRSRRKGGGIRMPLWKAPPPPTWTPPATLTDPKQKRNLNHPLLPMSPLWLFPPLSPPPTPPSMTSTSFILPPFRSSALSPSPNPPNSDLERSYALDQEPPVRFSNNYYQSLSPTPKSPLTVEFEEKLFEVKTSKKIPGLQQQQLPISVVQELQNNLRQQLSRRSGVA